MFTPGFLTDARTPLQWPLARPIDRQNRRLFVRIVRERKGPGMPPDRTATSPHPRVVVLNPGASQWMTMLAAGFARAGMLRKLVIPIGSPPAQTSNRAFRVLPKRLRRRLAEEHLRRQVPAVIGATSIQHAATISEYLSVATARVSQLGIARPIFQRVRNIQVDRDVARTLRRGDFAVVTCSTSAIRTLRRARTLGITSYLDYPIAHHSFMEAILGDEARRLPEWSGTIAWPRLPEWMRQQLAEEIAESDYILTLSTFQRDTFVEFGVEERKLVLAPLGVDLALFRPGARDEDGVFRIIFAGQVTQRKGISYLIEAFDRLAIPNSELLVVGSVVGTSKPWRGHPGLRFVPRGPRWALPGLYASADVYVLPSLVDGFGLTALEAMACALPVVLSEHTFGRDLVTDGCEGYVVPIRDVDAIVDRVRYLYDHPVERRTMGEAARRRAEDFSWEQYADRVVEAVGRRRSIPNRPLR